MVSAILWDNDGVLVDTETVFYRANREVLAAEGIELDTATFARYSFERGRSALDLALDCGGTPADVERLRRVRNDRYMALLRSGVTVLPGVEESLAALHGRFAMGIVTSSRRDHFDAIHDQLGLLRFFDFVLTPDDYGPHKPHPAPYLAAARRLGVSPRDCVAVEDTQRGVVSATEAGMTCLAIPHGLSRDGDLSRAHRVLASAAEVVETIEAIVTTE